MYNVSILTLLLTLNNVLVVFIPSLFPTKAANINCKMTMEPDVFSSFEPVTATWQYIVADPATHDAVIIDSVIDFNPVTNQISTETADNLLSLVSENNLTITHILETHAHADHLTASTYLQQQLVSLGKPRPDIGIGARITQVQSTFAPRYGIKDSELSNVFDNLFQDNEEFMIGKLMAKVLHLPGHTPDHVGYLIGENVFTGDSIFNPDIGSARADFPGGSAVALYKSTRTLLDLPGHYRLYVGHDYPPESRTENEAGEKHKPYTTVREQRADNRHVNRGVTEEEFLKFRLERDSVLGEPRLLHQSLQWNIRAGKLPKVTGAGDMFLRLPIKASKELINTMQEVNCEGLGKMTLSS